MTMQFYLMSIDTMAYGGSNYRNKKKKTDLFEFAGLAAKVQKFCGGLCVSWRQAEQHMMSQRVQEETTQLQMGHILPQLNLCQDTVQ
jgi:hypothetical protein